MPLTQRRQSLRKTACLVDRAYAPLRNDGFAWHSLHTYSIAIGLGPLDGGRGYLSLSARLTSQSLISGCYPVLWPLRHPIWRCAPRYSGA